MAGLELRFEISMSVSLLAIGFGIRLGIKHNQLFCLDHISNTLY